MKKLNLIKEIDLNGTIWFWIELDGTRVSPHYLEKELNQAEDFYNNFKIINPSKEILMERGIE